SSLLLQELRYRRQSGTSTNWSFLVETRRQTTNRDLFSAALKDAFGVSENVEN
ncbi:hypothetical protein J6590_105608, partial [Homalodisca vitripennis]